MKKTIIIALVAFISFVVVSCEKPEEIWEDNATPEVFFPRNGNITQTVWDVASGSYETYIGVYCSGLRPSNQTNSIDVTVVVDNALVDNYNANAQDYEEKLDILPSNCFTLMSNTATIEPGKVEAGIPIKFDVAAVKAAISDPEKHYVIPLRIENTSMYSISATKEFTEAFMQIVVKEPAFYFFCNKVMVSTQVAKLIHGTDANDFMYDVYGDGVPEGNYAINFKYDKAALDALYPGVDALPEDAVSIEPSSTYKNQTNHAYLKFRINPDNLEFFKVYYLPVTIDSPDYKADPVRGTLFMTIEVKNEFEKSYSNNFVVEVPKQNRRVTYSSTMNLVTYDSDIVEAYICKNASTGTIAGAKSTQSKATTYNDSYVRIKIIPTSDKSHYDIEYIPVTDKAKKNNTPEGFKPIEGAENYYDWNQEKFVLNYTWMHVDKTDTTWINVSSVLQAK